MPTLNVHADLDGLATIREFAAQAGYDLGLDRQGVYDLQLAVDEACANVVLHAYGGRGGEMEIAIEPAEGGVQVTIRDWGRAFEPQAVPSPDIEASLEQRRLGGLGLYLMRQVMDQVDFTFDAKNGNRLTMIKRLAEKGG
jgi:serine/threonine-protein kinase RsbW